MIDDQKAKTPAGEKKVLTGIGADTTLQSFDDYCCSKHGFLLAGGKTAIATG